MTLPAIDTQGVLTATALVSTQQVGAGATRSSGIISASGFRRVIGGILSNQAGTLVIRQAFDATGALWVKTRTIPIAANTSTPIHELLQLTRGYLEVVFTCGPATATSFNCYTELSPL